MLVLGHRSVEVRSYDYGGIQNWSTELESTREISYYSTSMTGSEGDVFIIHTASTSGFAITRVGRGGNVEWSRTVAGRPTSASMDPDDRLYVGNNQVMDEMGALRTTLMQFDPSGNVEWELSSDVVPTLKPIIDLVAVQDGIYVLGEVLMKLGRDGSQLWNAALP